MTTKMMRHSHKVEAKGRTLIERIENQMDKRRAWMEGAVLAQGLELCEKDMKYVINKGRYEGLAGALAILRTSSVAEEISRSNERLGI